MLIDGTSLTPAQVAKVSAGESVSLAPAAKQRMAVSAAQYAEAADFGQVTEQMRVTVPLCLPRQRHAFLVAFDHDQGNGLARKKRPENRVMRAQAHGFIVVW